MTFTATIEPMTIKDVEAVSQIEQASFEQPWSMQSIRAEMTRNDLAHYVVARAGEKLVGYGGIWLILDEAHVTTLAVSEPYRCCGIGTALLQALLQKASALGARRVSLEVRPSNHIARSLYDKFGFTVRGVRKHYYFDEDALVMTKSNLATRKEVANDDDDPAC